MSTERFGSTKTIGGEIVEIGPGQSGRGEYLLSFIVLKAQDGQLIRVRNATIGDAQYNEIAVGNFVKLHIRPMFSKVDLLRRNYVFALEGSRGYSFYSPQLAAGITWLIAVGFISPIPSAFLLFPFGAMIAGTMGGFLFTFLPIILMWSYAVVLFKVKIDVGNAIRRLRHVQRDSEASGQVPAYVNI